jgi:hypothetical protein
MRPSDSASIYTRTLAVCNGSADEHLQAPPPPTKARVSHERLYEVSRAGEVRAPFGRPNFMSRSHFGVLIRGRQGAPLP